MEEGEVAALDVAAIAVSADPASFRGFANLRSTTRAGASVGTICPAGCPTHAAPAAA
jgi:hypothetical protein